jgi:hypothetical protein
MIINLNFKKEAQALKKHYNNQRWKEALDLKSFEFETPFIGIIKFSNEITKAVMDRCVTKDICLNDNSELIVKIIRVILIVIFIR